MLLWGMLGPGWVSNNDIEQLYAYAEEEHLSVYENNEMIETLP